MQSHVEPIIGEREKAESKNFREEQQAQMWKQASYFSCRAMFASKPLDILAKTHLCGFLQVETRSFGDRHDFSRFVCCPSGAYRSLTGIAQELKWMSRFDDNLIE